MANEGAFKIIWKDSHREPQCAPNPAFPEGIDLDCSDGAAITCIASLPYPARRCGVCCRMQGLWHQYK